MDSVLLLEYERDPHSGRGRQVADMDEVRQVQMQAAKLAPDVEHIKQDVADIKIDLRRVDDKIAAVEQRLTGKIDSLRADFSSTKVWALGLYVGQAASLLFVMAKGFKWL